MPNVNFLIAALAALIPLLIGFIWFNPKVFGNAWMKGTGKTEEQLKTGANMPLTFGLTYLFSLMVAIILHPIVIHQFGVISVLMNEPGIQDPNSELGKWLAGFMAKYGNNFRTFKHGVLHGTITGIFIALPVIGVNGLFERKSAKHIFINAGYWIVCMALMGGVICAYSM